MSLVFRSRVSLESTLPEAPAASGVGRRHRSGGLSRREALRRVWPLALSLAGCAFREPRWIAAGADVVPTAGVFTVGRASFEIGGQHSLVALVNRLAGDTPERVFVSVHSCAIGSAACNQRLTEQRAIAIAALLHSEFPGAELTALGVGGKFPIADDRTADGRARNRRVEIAAS